MFNWNKKEAPLLGLLGSGGGLRYLAGGISVPAIGEQLFETAGTYTWTVPAQAAASGIDIVVIGGGGGGTLYPGNLTGGSGGGGARLSFINNHSVSAGQELTITVGAGGRGSYNGPNPAPIPGMTATNFVGNSGEDGGYSSVRNPGQPVTNSDSIIYAGGGGGSPGPAGGSGGTTQWNSNGGGNGGGGGAQSGNTSWWCFGGGAGGYGVPSANGTGGDGGRWQAGGPYTNGATAGAPNSGAAGGAAGWAVRTGVGVFGKGPTGAINSPGSGGTTNKYGGGGSLHGSSGASAVNAGQPGAVRIIWGPGRQFPDTGTGLDGGPAPS